MLKPVATMACLVLAASVGAELLTGAQDPPALPESVAARVHWARTALAPSGLQKLERMAGDAAAGIAAGKIFSQLQKETEKNRVLVATGLRGMDLSEAAFIVLAMAVEDMDEDLRMIIAELKAVNAAKRKLRDLIKQLNDWISSEMAKLAKAGKEPSDIENSRVSRKDPPYQGIVFTKTYSPVVHLEYISAPVIPPLPPRSSGVSVRELKDLRGDLKAKLDTLNELSEMTSLRLQMAMDRRSKFISTLSEMMKKTSTTQDALVQNIK